MQQQESTREDAMPRGPSAYVVWGIFAVWITFSWGGFTDLAHTRPSPHWFVTLAGVVLFFALYLWTAWQIARRLTGDTPIVTRATMQIWMPILALSLISLFMAVFAGYTWGGFFIYTTAIAAGSLPIREGLWATFVFAAISVTGSLIAGKDGNAVLAALFTILVTGFTTIVSMWAFNTNRELRLARKELARLAVTDERLRFARDLHDLLGHTLSLITLKSELAGRLVSQAPERAAAEIGDIEAAARQALHEVREAVAGYRQPTLAGELQSAREMLAAAGIDFRLEEAGAEISLRPAVEAMLAWAVREGVTNVIRHSRARHCTIRVTYQKESAGVTVSDDGRGDAGGTSGTAGNGLRGLAERARELGGTCEAQRLDAGGFRLAVTLPLATTQQSVPAARVQEEVRR